MMRWKEAARVYLDTRARCRAMAEGEFAAYYGKWWGNAGRKLLEAEHAGEGEACAKWAGFRDALTDERRVRDYALGDETDEENLWLNGLLAYLYEESEGEDAAGGSPLRAGGVAVGGGGAAG